MKALNILSIVVFSLLTTNDAHANWIDRLDAAVTKVRMCRDLFKPHTESMDVWRWRNYTADSGEPTGEPDLIKEMFDDILGEKPKFQIPSSSESGLNLKSHIPETPYVEANRTREFMKIALRNRSATVYENGLLKVRVKRLRDGAFVAFVDKFLLDEGSQARALLPMLTELATHSLMTVPMNALEKKQLTVQGFLDLVESLSSQDFRPADANWRDKAIANLRVQAWRKFYTYKFDVMAVDDHLNSFGGDVSIALATSKKQLPETKQELDAMLVQGVNIAHAIKNRDESWFRRPQYFSKEQVQQNLKKLLQTTEGHREYALQLAVVV